MNLPKALELLNAILVAGKYEGDPDDSQAVRLGIETLKQELQTRQEYPDLDWTLLPGETKD